MSAVVRAAGRIQGRADRQPAVRRQRRLAEISREFALEQLVPVVSEPRQATGQAASEEPIAQNEIAVAGDVPILRTFEVARRDNRARAVEQQPASIPLFAMTAP